MKQAALEERLLGSIAERGIEEPLEGVNVVETRILVNGFKRYRCARKLRLAAVPYASLGRDEAAGIIALLRASNERALGILEQAAFIDELRSARNLIAGGVGVEAAVKTMTLHPAVKRLRPSLHDWNDVFGSQA